MAAALGFLVVHLPCLMSLQYSLFTGPSDKESPGEMKIPNILEVGSRRSRFRFIGESLAGSWVVALLGFSGYVLHFNSAPVGFSFSFDRCIGSYSLRVLAGHNRVDPGLRMSRLFVLSPVSDLEYFGSRDWVALGCFETERAGC